MEPPEYLTRRIMGVQSEQQRPLIAPAPEQAPLPRKFGPYLLEAILGRGGSGTVYRGYDAELERHVAVKVLSPSLSQDQSARSRFLREARAMAGLSDDALMPLLAVHQDTPGLCFTMPLLEGETLQSRLNDRGSLEVVETVLLVEQICQGLAVAHESGLVHRDLKPSNIFLEAREGPTRVRLMDFGLVKTNDEPSVTRVGEITGTPSFMSPEQIDGLELDGRADLYSLGATLFMLLSGKPPYEGKTLTATLRQAAVGEAPSLHKAATGVPSWLADLVSDLLKSNPSHRPSSAREVLERLKGRSGMNSTTLRSDQILLISGLVAVFLVSLMLVGYLFFEKWSKGPQGNFGLLQELALLDSGGTLQIPAGKFTLNPLDLGARDITLVGSGRETQLVFVASEEVSIQTSGNLEIRNLVLDCSDSLPEGGGPLIESQGGSALVEAAEGSETRIQATEIYCFSSMVWRSRQRARLVVEDSVVVAPGLVFAKTEEGLGEVEVSRTTCVTQIFASLLVTDNKGSPLGLSIAESAIDCSFAFLWFPLGDEELLKDSLAYKGRDSLVMLSRGFVTTSLRPRGGGPRVKGELDSWLSQQWANFWGSDEQNVERSSRLISRADMFQDTEMSHLEDPALVLPSEHQGMGANLTKAGPVAASVD